MSNTRKCDGATPNRGQQTLSSPRRGETFIGLGPTIPFSFGRFVASPTPTKSDGTFPSAANKHFRSSPRRGETFIETNPENLLFDAADALRYLVATKGGLGTLH